MSTARLFPRARRWRRVLLIASTSGAAALLAAAGAAAVIGGSAAAGSAAFGGGAVAVISFTTLALVDWSDRRAPGWTMRLFLVGFAVKVVGLVLLAAAVPPADWLQPGWAIGAGIGTLVVWQTAQIFSFASMRLPIEPQPERPAD
ncbi:hypothetical protein [Nesterenkonia sp.]|uniref:hypothetical protein n=1 Tax=Nesterenkonia sp. TaxID=704201 RepID=UPI0026148340|nr:hypothetical protein [Nesterenkonia sp.]